jgi:hypothetical protein
LAVGVLAFDARFASSLHFAAVPSTKSRGTPRHCSPSPSLVHSLS